MSKRSWAWHFPASTPSSKTVVRASRFIDIPPRAPRIAESLPYRVQIRRSWPVIGCVRFDGKDAERLRMSYIDANLIPGEKVVYQTRLHWVVMLGHMLFAILVLGLPGGVLFYYARKEQAEASAQNQHLMLGGAGVLLIAA